jgi:hypothetical protein
LYGKPDCDALPRTPVAAVPTLDLVLNDLVPRNPLNPVRKLVLDAVSSPLTRVMYARALDDFFCWWETQGRPTLNRAAVQAYRAHLESQGLAPASVNQKLSAIRTPKDMQAGHQQEIHAEPNGRWRRRGSSVRFVTGKPLDA